jgi:probable phosphoglycerate mutase
MPDQKIKKTIYFVRHGQSEHNIAPVFQSPDSPLNELGRKQAASTAQRVSKLSFNALITSPFERAKETAEIISKSTGKEYELSDLFVERVKPTVVNGTSYEDKEDNDIWRKWEKSLYTPGMRVADGENFDDLVARADKALKFLENRTE